MDNLICEQKQKNLSKNIFGDILNIPMQDNKETKEIVFLSAIQEIFEKEEKILNLTDKLREGGPLYLQSNNYKTINLKDITTGELKKKINKRSFKCKNIFLITFSINCKLTKNK